MTNSLAIVTRAYDAEAPYIESFIEYYTRIGVNEFHIVVPNKNPYKNLQKQCEKFTNIQWHIEYDIKTHPNLNGVQSVPLPFITSTHILSVDIDEYLDIENVSPLLQHDYLKLNWTIAPYQDYTTKKLNCFLDGQSKYLVKKELCNALYDHHADLNSLTVQTTSNVQLIHYIYRSFNDLYLKCALSNYGDYQATQDHQFIDGLADCKKLPLKFKMAAIYKRITDASNPLTINNYCQINKEIENKMVLSSCNEELLDELTSALSKYASRIDLVNFIKLVKKNQYFKEYGRLPHFVLADLADQTLSPALLPQHWIKQNRKQSFIGRIKKRFNFHGK